MRSGKLAPDELRRLVLGKLGTRRPEVLVHAALGEDSAVVDVGSDVMVLSTDPITAAGERAGWLGVHVACNDIAAMGATPVAILATVLVPLSADTALLETIMDDMDRAARELGIEIVGGHTEVTPSIAAPILSMTSIGRAPADRIVRSSGARPGDSIVLVKWAGLEGTAILATDRIERLRGVVSEETIVAAQRCIDLVSVVREGPLAAELGATAMHDPTEGGVLGALWEMAEASDCGFELDADAVPIRDETRAVCEVFGVDPLRLISSGALLVTCPDGVRLVDEFRAQGLQATMIGHMTEEGCWIQRSGQRVPAEPVWRDELWRVLEAG
jgi:hydrogenase expression/formation protein HypE